MALSLLLVSQILPWSLDGEEISPFLGLVQTYWGRTGQGRNGARPSDPAKLPRMLNGASSPSYNELFLSKNVIIMPKRGREHSFLWNPVCLHATLNDQGPASYKNNSFSLVSKGRGSDFLCSPSPNVTTTLTSEGSQPCIIWPGWMPSSAHKSLSYNSHLFYQLPNTKKHSHILCNLISVIFRLSKAKGSEQGAFLPRFEGSTGLYSSPENRELRQKRYWL